MTKLGDFLQTKLIRHFLEFDDLGIQVATTCFVLFGVDLRLHSSVILNWCALGWNSRRSIFNCSNIPKSKSFFLITYNVNVADKIVIADRQKLRPILPPHLLIMYVLSELSLAFNIRSSSSRKHFLTLPWDLSRALYAF